MVKGLNRFHDYVVPTGNAPNCTLYNSMLIAMQFETRKAGYSRKVGGTDKLLSNAPATRQCLGNSINQIVAYDSIIAVGSLHYEYA